MPTCMSDAFRLHQVQFQWDTFLLKEQISNIVDACRTLVVYCHSLALQRQNRDHPAMAVNRKLQVWRQVNVSPDYALNRLKSIVV